MADMLGGRVLPEMLNEQRRKLRSRLRDVRQPIRERREQSVPGPDVVGGAEEKLSDARQRLLDRDLPTDALPSIRGDDSDDSGSDGGSSSGGSGGGDQQPMT